MGEIRALKVKKVVTSRRIRRRRSTSAMPGPRSSSPSTARLRTSLPPTILVKKRSSPSRVGAKALTSDGDIQVETSYNDDRRELTVTPTQDLLDGFTYEHTSNISGSGFPDAQYGDGLSNTGEFTISFSVGDSTTASRPRRRSRSTRMTSVATTRASSSPATSITALPR